MARSKRTRRLQDRTDIALDALVMEEDGSDHATIRAAIDAKYRAVRFRRHQPG
jgi:hypothetical protein